MFNTKKFFASFWKMLCKLNGKIDSREAKEVIGNLASSEDLTPIYQNHLEGEWVLIFQLRTSKNESLSFEQVQDFANKLTSIPRSLFFSARAFETKLNPLLLELIDGQEAGVLDDTIISIRVQLS